MRDVQNAELVDLIDPLLGTVEPRPVLVDVGALTEVRPVWRPLARQSIYVGFDPDLQGMRQKNDQPFHRAFVLNQAVTYGPAATIADGDTATQRAQVTIRLTRAPQCSSTLRPNRAVLDHYVGSDRFDVLREASVTATTLDAALHSLGLDRADWLKLDTQGTDLRLFNNLSDRLKRSVLAIDAEPGLCGAYEGEDLFGDLHSALMHQGFWCASMTIKGLPRGRPATLAALATGFGDSANLAGSAASRSEWSRASPEEAAKGLPASPGWVECRYLRTAESLAEASSGPREYVLLWAFALAAGQPGFAGDLTIQYGRRFGPDPAWRAMAATAANCLHRAWAAHLANQVTRPGLATGFRRGARYILERIGIRLRNNGKTTLREPAAFDLQRHICS